jgi:hypothetical protein
MRRETEMLFAHVLRERLPATDLLVTSSTFLNRPLARFYGLESLIGKNDGDAKAMRLVDLPADSHRGSLLTHGSILAATSNPTRTSPVKRGLFILENLLGTPAPPAPLDVPALERTAATKQGATMRELMAVHREAPLCASCHARMDPLGLALESSPAARAAGAAARVAPTRMAFLYVPNGVILDRFRSTGSGRDFRLGETLEPLTPFQRDLQIVTGLGHQHGTAGGDGPGDHARASATILTGARPFKAAGSDIRVGVSVDQEAARRIGVATRFSSLELSCDGVRKSGACDSGYACAYQFNISWRSPTQPATPESNPRLVFERLFGTGSREERAKSMAARLELDRSILDFVADDARRLSVRLGGADRRKLDEYLHGVREIEQRLVRLERLGLPDVPDRELPDRRLDRPARRRVRLIAAVTPSPVTGPSRPSPCAPRSGRRRRPACPAPPPRAAAGRGSRTRRRCPRAPSRRRSRCRARRHRGSPARRSSCPRRGPASESRRSPRRPS